MGLYYYGTRWYDPVLGRFIQADTIIPDPGNPIDFDRYAYVRNNPIKYVDPTGYFTQDELLEYLGYETWKDLYSYFKENDLLDVLDLLLRADITFGSILIAGNNGAVDLQAMFLLYDPDGAGGKGYTLTLWDMNRGRAVDWKDLGGHSQIGVWTDNGKGFEQVYENYEGATKGFTPPGGSVEDLLVEHPIGTSFQWITRGPNLGAVIFDGGLAFEGLLLSTETGGISFVLTVIGAGKFMFEMYNGTMYPTMKNYGNYHDYGSETLWTVVFWDLPGAR